MPTQVFIVTSERDSSAGRDIEQKLKRRETVVVIQETRDPKIKDISKTEVICYDPDACKQTAQSVINVLQAEGFDVGKPTQRDGGPTVFKKRVEIVLAEAKKSEPITATRKKRNKPTRRR